MYCKQFWNPIWMFCRFMDCCIFIWKKTLPFLFHTWNHRQVRLFIVHYSIIYMQYTFIWILYVLNLCKAKSEIGTIYGNVELNPDWGTSHKRVIRELQQSQCGPPWLQTGSTTPQKKRRYCMKGVVQYI